MNFAAELLAIARQQGARDAEVYQTRTRSRPVIFEANRLKQLESSASEGIALRVWMDNRPGLAVAYGEVEPQTLVEKAIALAQLNDAQEIELAPARQENHPAKGKILSVAELIDMGNQAIAAIRDVHPEVLCSGEWDCEEQTTRLLNSRGLDCQYTQVDLSVALGVQWIRGDDFLEVYDGQQAYNTLDTESLVHALLGRLAWVEKNAVPIPGRVPVVLTAKAADLLWATVASALNGKRVLEQSSPWSDRCQQQVIAPSLSFFQDPNAIPFDCPFDDEGMPTQQLPLITSGTIESFYCDRTVGRELGTGSTGNGFRPGLGHYPTPGLANLIIAPGAGNLETLIQQLDEGIVIDQILGGGADISGDFSVNIDLGYRIQNGEIIGRIKDTMVSGNVYQALKQNVILGSDRDWNGSCYTPSAIVEGLSITSSDRSS